MTSGVLSLTIRRAAPADAALLATFAATAFADTFAADNRPADMAAYLAASFDASIQGAELADPRNVVLLAERGGALVGYAMLRESDAPDAALPSGRDAIEIARFYASRESIGTGVGAALMRRCLDEAAARGRRGLWLGVWEHNARAIAFYRRWGFTDVGSQPFQLGTDLQTDRIMARRGAEEECRCDTR